jgi:hypothetical protein
MLPKNKFKIAAKFKMATKTLFAYVATKTLVCLKTFGQFEKYKIYLEAPKLKMAAQFKMIAKI